MPVPIPAPTSAALRVPRSGIRTLMDLALRDPEALHLEIGEPDQGVAPHVVEAAAAAGREGRTGYTSSVGLPALRAAVAQRVTLRSGRPTSAEQVVITHGAMHGLAMTFQTLLGPGDEVLLPDPMFPNWAMAVTAAGAVPRTYPTRAEHGFVPSAAEVEASITPRTRAILVCSPDNPTGAVYPAAALEELVEVARRHDLWLVSDECYEAITFGVPFVSPAAFDTDGRVVVLGSVSKTYAMTGWRIGWVATPDRNLLEVLGHLSEALVACPSTVGQIGAVAALTGPRSRRTGSVATPRRPSWPRVGSGMRSRRGRSTCSSTSRTTTPTASRSDCLRAGTSRSRPGRRSGPWRRAWCGSAWRALGPCCSKACPGSPTRSSRPVRHVRRRWPAERRRALVGQRHGT